MLKQIQTQKQSQKLLPKIVVRQNLLAMPAIALEALVKRELEQNPMLEEGQEDENQPTDDAFLNEESDKPDEVQMRDEPSPAASESGTEAEEEFSTAEKPDRDEEYDWDEYFENEAEEYHTSDNGYAPEFDGSGSVAGDINSVENLVLQLHLSELPRKIIFAGEEIIWSLDEDGFFREDNADILKDLELKKIGTEFENDEFTEDDITDALVYIQDFLDPPGIGARDLKECLLIQIERRKMDERLKKLAIRAVSRFFPDLMNKRFEKLEKELDASAAELTKVFDLLHELNPKPGSGSEGEPDNYIVPDLIVKGRDGFYDVFLNEKYTPALRISNNYKKMYQRRDDLDKQTKDYLLNNFNKAKWFIDAVNSRRDTLIRIMEAIIKRQKEYFQTDGEKIKPLQEKEIADDIKMDTSTVSRAVKNKYVQTDFGIIHLRSFFTPTMHKSGGEDVSNSEIKAKLGELIMSENKTRPLTDHHLSAELEKLGYKVARRTVAKYRESIGYPVAKLRREIKNK